MQNKKTRIINSLWTFSIAVICFGPFALPLLWRNPRFSKKTKIVASIAVILGTLGLLWISDSLLGQSLTQLKNAYQQYQELQKL